MKIIPLGTNGFFPSFNRQTACYVIPYKKILIILDAGSGLFRFAEPKVNKLLGKSAEIHLFLSHYHLDHTFGFYGSFILFSGKKVSVFGPREKQVFSEFVKMRHFPVNYSKVHNNFSWKKVIPGRNKIADYEVFVRQQFHRGEGSLAYRLEFPDKKSLAYITDSEPNTESIEFVRGVKILLHEHEKEGEKSTYYKGIKLSKLYEDGHVTIQGAAVIAKAATVKKLYLIHHNPFARQNELNSELIKAKKIFKESYLTSDLKDINF